MRTGNNGQKRTAINLPGDRPGGCRTDSCSSVWCQTALSQSYTMLMRW